MDALTGEHSAIWTSALGVLGITALLGWSLSRQQTGRPWVWLAILVADVFLWLGALRVEQAVIRNESDKLGRILLSFAPGYAREIERLGHAEIDEDTLPDDPRYLAMIEAERRWLASNRLVADVYTMRRLADGRMVLMVDSETDYDGNGVYEGDREARTPIGEVYGAAADDPALESALMGQPAFSDHITSDRWGTWVGAYVPLFDHEGNVEGVLGVDYPADAYLAAMGQTRHLVVALALAISLILLSVGLYVENARLRVFQAREECDLQREMRRRFQAVFEGSADALLVLDRSGAVVNANSRAADLFGVGLDEMNGRRLDDWMVESARGELVRLVERAWREEIREKRATVRGREGGVVPIAVASSRIELGGEQALLLHLTDLRELEESRRRLEEAHHRIAFHVENSPLAFIEWDEEMRVKVWSRRAEEIFGWSEDEVLGKQPFDWRFIYEGDVRQVRDELEKLAEDGTVRRTSRNRNYRRDGSVIHCQWFSSRRRDAEGNFVSYASFVQDMTETCALEEQLHQAQKMQSIGQLASGVAHDFNNLLTVIQGHTQLLLSAARLGPRMQESVNEIAAASDRAANLTRQLLTFSRRQAVLKEHLDLNTVIRDMTRMLKRLLREAVELVFEPSCEALMVHADRRMLEQVVMNLSLNAQDAMPEGGMLELKTELVRFDRDGAVPAGEYACLEVVDSGSGMDEETLRRVFEPFFTTKDVGEGSGLGLSTAYGIAAQHAGSIRAESVPGVGSIFRFYLPIAKRPEAPARTTPEQGGAVAAGSRASSSPAEAGSPAALPDERTGPPCVLVVEDEPAVRSFARVTLLHTGYRVLDAASGREALEIWAREKDGIDLLVTDLVMPQGVSGKELGERVIADRPGMAIVYMSGYSEDVLGGGIDFDRPGARFLQKPFAPQRLAEIAREALDESRQSSGSSCGAGSEGDADPLTLPA